MWIRRILLAGPLVLAGVFFAAYLTARPYFDQRIEQLTIASIGEPERLNPIISTTVSAAIIGYFLFDSLLQLDENAEIQPCLAERYELAQRTRLYFSTAEQAHLAADAVRDRRAQWSRLSLRSVRTLGDAVVLQFRKPGTGYRDVLLEWIKPAKPLEVQRWEISVDSEFCITLTIRSNIARDRLTKCCKPYPSSRCLSVVITISDRKCKCRMLSSFLLG